MKKKKKNSVRQMNMKMKHENEASVKVIEHLRFSTTDELLIAKPFVLHSYIGSLQWRCIL